MLDPVLPDFFDFFGFSLLLSVATGGSPAEANAGVIAGAAISAIENIAMVVSLIAKRLTRYSCSCKIIVGANVARVEHPRSDFITTFGGDISPALSRSHP